MSLYLALLMREYQIKNIESSEIDLVKIVFSPEEFVQVFNNRKRLSIIFDDCGIDDL